MRTSGIWLATSSTWNRACVTLSCSHCRCARYVQRTAPACARRAALGSLIWVSGLSVLGREVGHQWTTWRHHLEYVDYAAAAVVVAVIVWFLLRFVRSRRQRAGTPHSAAEPTPDVVPD